MASRKSGKKKSGPPKARLDRQLANLALKVDRNTSMLEKTIEGKQMYKQYSAFVIDNQGSQADNYNNQDLLGDLTRGVADTDSPGVIGARIGNSVTIKSMFLRLHISAQAAVTATNGTEPTLANSLKNIGTCRVLIYNSPCGKPLGMNDILRDASSPTRALVSHYQVSVGQGDQYEILYDKVFDFSDGMTMKYVKFAQKFKKGKVALYDDNATLPSNFRPRILFIVKGTNPVNGIEVSYDCKTRFVDA